MGERKERKCELMIQFLKKYVVIEALAICYIIKLRLDEMEM